MCAVEGCEWVVCIILIPTGFCRRLPCTASTVYSQICVDSLQLYVCLLLRVRVLILLLPVDWKCHHNRGRVFVIQSPIPSSCALMSIVGTQEIIAEWMEVYRLNVLCIDSVYSKCVQYLFLETAGINAVLRFVLEEFFGIQMCYKIQFGDYVCEY